MIVAFGDYKGGELLVKNSNGTVKQIDINRKPFYFYGHSELHWTAPFTGTRYSLVFYNHHHHLVERPQTTDSKVIEELLGKKMEYTKFFK